MRITKEQAQAIVAGWVLVVAVAGAPTEFYAVGNRAGAIGRVAELTARGDVFEVALWFVQRPATTLAHVYAGVYAGAGAV